MSKRPVFTRENDEITCHLLSYQTKAKDSEKQISGIVAGRGAGKSIWLSAMTLLEMVQGGKVLLLAQNYKSLKLNLFQEILDRFRECELEPQVSYGDMTIKFGSGMLLGFSYENVDSVRGISGVSLLVLDELALAPQNLFETVNPCLRGTNRKTRIIFATTPRKGTVWNRWFRDNTVEKDIFTATMMDNTELDKDEIELQKKSITDPNAYRQEILGEILDSSVDFAIITFDEYPKVKRFTELDKRICKLGIDLSGFGADDNVFIVTDQDGIIEKVKIKVADTFELYNTAKELITRYKIREVSLDCTGGFGNGLYDMLKQDKSLTVNPINFGSSAIENTKYANKRAEMYMTAMDKIRNGFYIDDDDIKNELSYMSYKINGSGKTQLESKSLVKELLGHSPDSADALVLSMYDTEEKPIYQSPNESLNIALKFVSI